MSQVRAVPAATISYGVLPPVDSSRQWVHPNPCRSSPLGLVVGQVAAAAVVVVLVLQLLQCSCYLLSALVLLYFFGGCGKVSVALFYALLN
jgi:hypothetical protein